MKSRASMVAVFAALLALCLTPLSWSSAESEAAAEETVTIHMFMGNSGVPHPADVDPSSNWAIDVVEKLANVDLILEVPNYQDFATKINLLLASGNLPDIVHGWQKADLENAADAGAFIDHKPYYDNSPIMQARVSQLAFDLAATPNGLHFAMPMVMSAREPGWGNLVRYDLLEEYNGGEFPGTIDGYLDFLRWVRDTYEGSTPLSSRLAWGGRLFATADAFFLWYGVPPYGTRIQDGTVHHNFTLPAMKEALKLWRQVFEEGILDPEFATSDTAAWVQKRSERQVSMFSNATDQVIPGYDNMMNAGQVWVYTPPLDEYPEALTDPKYMADLSINYGVDIFPISSHRTGITSAAKDPDRAWRVLEAFASDELWDVIAWGREGKEYTVEGGTRKATDRLYFRDLDDPDAHYWTLHLGTISGFWPTQVKYAVQAERYPMEWQRVHDSAQWLMDKDREVGLSYLSFVPTDPEVSRKAGEVNPFISAAIAKAITGQITLDEFDEEVAKFQQEFGFIYDYQTQYVQDHKDELRSKNVRMVDW